MSRNKTVVPEAREALEKFKMEIANELSADNSNPIDSGALASKHTGYITRKLVELAEKELAENSGNIGYRNL
ncbi:MAG: alpha/beta-type small acid-soluble spore protein [Peptostreptococcales bacterium]